MNENFICINIEFVCKKMKNSVLLIINFSYINGEFGKRNSCIYYELSFIFIKFIRNVIKISSYLYINS